MFNFSVIIYIIPVIITLQIGVFIYFAGREKYLNKVFFLLSIFIVLWHLEGSTTYLSAPWKDFFSIGGILLPVAFLQFSLALANYPTTFRSGVIFLGYVWAGFLLAGDLSPLLVLREYLQFGFGGPHATGLFVYLVYFLAYTLSAEIFLIQQARQYRGDPKARRYLFVAVAALAAILSGAMQAGPLNSPTRYWVAAIFNLAYTLVMGWAIWRYEILEVSTKLRTTAVYSVILALVLVGYLTIVQVLSTLLMPFVKVNLLWAGMLATLIIGPLFYPLRERFNNIVKRFFPLTADVFYDKLRTFSQELAHLVPLEQVATKILRFISEVFNIQHAELVITGSNGSLRSWRLSREDELKITEGCFHYPGICVHGFENIITIPIGSRDQIIGWLKLGQPTKGILTKEDKELINSFLGQAGTALHNALLFTELSSLIRHYEALLQGTINGVMVLDERLRIITINPVAARIFGVVAEQVRNRYLPELPGAQALEMMIARLKQSGKPISNTEDFVGPDQAKVPVKINIFSFIENEETDTPPSIIIVLADLTERKEAEKQFRRTERLAAMGRLTTGLAHELRNGLNKIGGFAAILEDLTTDQPDLAYYSKGIQEDVQDLADFLNRFLAFAREREYNLTKVEIIDVLKRDLETLQSELNEVGVNVVEDYRGEPCVPGDRHQLSMAFFNLLVNAVQALAEAGGGTLTIRAYEQGGSCFIEIEDDGPGIPAEKQESIFDPFYTTKEAGTGLGLPTAYKVITGHHGSLTLKSSEGQGTVFTIELPICTAETPDRSDGMEADR